MVFCNMLFAMVNASTVLVTILILVDGFLQYGLTKVKLQTEVGHNPYFSRWFSAISYILKR